MDRIFVEKLALRGKHGVHHKERQEEQDFLIDIAVEFGSRKAAETDDIVDTADYVQFVEVAREAVERNSFYLIEKLAQRIADGILADVRLKKVEVTVRKPEALESGVPGITIVRTR